MAQEVSKEQAMEAIERERSRWEALVTVADPARMEEPGVAGDYSFKDVAAHLTRWLDWEIDRIEAALQGEDARSPWPAYLDTDGINAWMQQRDRERGAEGVLVDASQVYRRLTGVIAAMPEGTLNDPAAFPWIAQDSLGASIAGGGFFEHLGREHEPGIRTWLHRPRDRTSVQVAT